MVWDLGRRPYDEVWRLQLELRDCRIRDEIEDHLLFVEHPPVITVGKKSDASSQILSAGETPVFEVERGGGATYHGPGQLVGYPILKLPPGGRDLTGFLRTLEQVLIDALATYGIRGDRVEGLTGVWVDGRKIASIGIAVRRWVTYHGFALNVSTDLGRFSSLQPCGLDAQVMTSMAQELQGPIGAPPGRENPLEIDRAGKNAELDEFEPGTQIEPGIQSDPGTQSVVKTGGEALRDQISTGLARSLGEAVKNRAVEEDPQES